MIYRFDHAVVPVRDLDQALALWRDRLGFDACYGGKHSGAGTHNGIVRFGTDYIELISVLDRDAVLTRRNPNTDALVTLLDRAEGGMLGFVLATDDIDAEAERFRQLGLKDAFGPFPLERLRPDGKLLKWRLLSPRRGSWGTPWTTLIHWEVPDAERLTWEEPGFHPNGAERITNLAIAIGDLEQGVHFYERELGLAPIGLGKVPELGARRASYLVGHTQIDLLAPVTAGPIASAIAAGDEKPWQVTIAVRDLEAARRHLAEREVPHGPSPGTPGGILIDPAAALGARLVLVQSS